jgi:hypothetical protein
VGLLSGDPKRYLEKSLETGISLHMGLRFWGTWRRARLPGTLRVEKALETGISSYRGSVWGTWRRAVYWGL